MTSDRDAGRYYEQCEQVAAHAHAAGLRMVGPIANDLGWRPGVVLAHPLSDKVWEFAVAHGYVATPSGQRHTLIEVAR